MFWALNMITVIHLGNSAKINIFSCRKLQKIRISWPGFVQKRQQF
jgi:hypothetical protein